MFYNWQGGVIPIPGTPKGKQVFVPDFSLRTGQVIIIEGSSGCGKSFLLSVLAGTASSSVIKDKEDRAALRALPPVNKAVLIQQHPAFREGGTVRDEVRHTWQTHLWSLSEKSKAEINQLIESRAKSLGLHGDLDKTISTLSGGQKKRFGLLLRLPLPTNVIFLDEPDSGVDTETFQRFLKDLTDSSFFGEEVPPRCFVIVSHNSNAIKEVLPENRITLVRLEKAPQRSENYAQAENIGTTKTTDDSGCNALLQSFWHAICLSCYSAFKGDWKSVVFIALIALAVYCLVSLNATQDIPLLAGGEIKKELGKHGFFAVIASLWLGVQISSRYILEHWSAWREDHIWSIQQNAYLSQTEKVKGSVIDGVRFGFSTLFVLSIWMFVIAILGTMVFVAMGVYHNGLLSGIREQQILPFLQTFGKTFFTFFISSGYGLVLGLFAATGALAISVRIGKKRPPELLLSMIVPSIVLVHLILSSRFLSLKTENFQKFVEEHSSSLLAKVANWLPSNHFSQFFEDTTISLNKILYMSPYAFLLILAIVIVTLIATVLTLTSKDTRE